jgi:ABC-2 type transport system ATP-binding protein
MNNVVIKTENLVKRYGALTAVNRLSLEVYEGEIFGFLGPNGAGKTTSINMLCGLLRPDAGRVLVHGVPMDSGAAETRTRVGMCPQTIVLWERLTCLEQLEFMGQMYGMPAGLARRRSLKLLDDLDLADKRNKQARTLSGGMQRRLNLAMALVHDPEIVVLDEPEAGLDPQSRVRVREYLQSLARHKTVILTTHNMDEADRVVDRVAIIDHGELLELDTPEVLKQRVGEGDVIEIRLGDGRHDEAEARAALAGLAAEVRLEPAAHTLRVRALNAVGQLADILAALTRAGIQPSDVNIRANTLEDVFLKLTGRRLRE